MTDKTTPTAPGMSDPAALLLGAIARAGRPREYHGDCEEESPPGIRTVVCPYNNLHVIRRSKLIAHLRKCRRENIQNDYIFCIFNESHLVEVESLPAHHRSCPDNPANKEAKLLEYVRQTGGFTDSVSDGFRSE